MEIDSVVEVLQKSGKTCGIVATNFRDIENRTKQGFGMFAVGLNSGLIINGLKHILEQVGRESKIHSDLSPSNKRST
ncbi:MAG: hypothetical protein HKN87_21245 [Saprospiraceae bacterium]|nr:hypothetical protein [Saprospiraceae bacterium]